MPAVDLSSLLNCRQVVGFPDYYVTKDARVFSRFRLGRPRTRCGDANGVQRLPEGLVQEIVCGPHHAGYRVIGLRRNGSRVGKTVHSIVLEAFVGPCPDGMECRHLNGDPANSTLGNLCWGTPLENAADKQRHGTMERGVKHHAVKLTVDAVLDIKRRCHNGERQKDIAKLHCVSPGCVSAIAIGRTWSHVNYQ